MSPAEFTIIAQAHAFLGPRIWLAGRRRMSRSAAAFSTASATAATARSRRVPGVKSSRRLAMVPSALYRTAAGRYLTAASGRAPAAGGLEHTLTGLRGCHYGD